MERKAHKNTGTARKGIETIAFDPTDLQAALERLKPVDDLALRHKEITTMNTARVAAGMTVAKLAELLDIPRTTLKEWCNHRVMPSQERWDQIKLRLLEIIT